jgi:hypothetical protein
MFCLKPYQWWEVDLLFNSSNSYIILPIFMSINTIESQNHETKYSNSQTHDL